MESVENFKREIKRMKIAFTQLTSREREILKSRWGFNFRKKKTLEELSKRYKITREGVRGIEERAEKKINEIIKNF